MGSGAMSIMMPRAKFIKEHEHLIKLLRSSDDPRMKAEADKQEAELRREMKGGGREDVMVELAEGGSRNSGFIARMMGEVKLKHNGKYKTPTAPLAKSSTMNAPAAFEYKKVRKPSEFLKKTFGKSKPRQGTNKDLVLQMWEADKSLTTRAIVKKMKDDHDKTISQPTVARILKKAREEPKPIKAVAPKKSEARAVANPVREPLKTLSKAAIERQEPSYKASDAPAYKAPAKAKAKKAKMDSLAKYLKGYSGKYQDYEDSRGAEVIYPTTDIKQIISLAYNGNTLREIVKTAGYNKEETATIIYDHYINRGDISNPKTYIDEKSVMEYVGKSGSGRMRGGMERGIEVKPTPKAKLDKEVRKYMKKMRDEFLDLIEINSQLSKRAEFSADDRKYIMDELTRRADDALASSDEDTASEE